MRSAILFHGDDHELIKDKVRKHAQNELVAADIDALLNHGDYQEVAPTSKSYLYSMETIQRVIEESALPPFRGKCRIIVLFAADRMLPVHANALLKTLEDAPLSFHLILTTTRYNDILKTILSRVQKEHVDGVSESIDFVPYVEQAWACLEQSFYESFIKEIEGLEKLIIDPIEEAEKNFRLFLEAYLLVYSKKGMKGSIFVANIDQVQRQISEALKDQAVNIRIKHILENLFLGTQLQSYNIR